MLTLITVATQRGRYMPFFLETCVRAGMEPLILGEGKRWTGFGLKLSLLRDYLRRRRGKRGVLLFADAHDSFLLEGAEGILERFRRMKHPLIFSAEKFCWPDPWKAFMYPPARTPYRFLNSGGFIGEIEALRDHLETLPRRVPGGLDDQGWWTNRLLADPASIQLDTRCELFQTLLESTGKLEMGTRIVNTATRTRPCVLHGNGQIDLTPFIEWYSRRHRTEREGQFRRQSRASGVVSYPVPGNGGGGGRLPRKR